MYTAVLERTREIGILKAVGAGTPVYILNILFRETIMLAVFGTIFGILMTLRHAVADATRCPPLRWSRRPRITGGRSLRAIAIIGALLGTVIPAMRAVKTGRHRGPQL